MNELAITHGSALDGSGVSEDWFHQLEGTWTLQRRIVQASAAPSGGARMTGIVTLERRDENVLCYREDGILKMANGATVHATRCYLYRWERGALLIDFADGPDQGRRFLKLDLDDADTDADVVSRHTLREWRLADNHLCGRDLYQAEYRFSQQQTGGQSGDDERRSEQRSEGSGTIVRISQRTVVNGPRKDYAIVSVLRRKAIAAT